MEKKQLDLNQPLRSVRRLPPATPSEKRRPVPARKRVRVPFLWEQSPGRPKAKNPINQTHSLQNPNPLLPKLPPGRILNVKRPVSSDHGAKFRSSKDGYEAYRDALETLSRIESFFLTSFHGLDGKPSGTFTIDPQTRDVTTDFGKRPRNLFTKFHRLLPKFCLKSSICLLKSSRPGFRGKKSLHEMHKFAEIEGINGTRSSTICSNSFRKLLGDHQRTKGEDFKITEKHGDFSGKPGFEASIKMLNDLGKDQNPWIGSASFRYYYPKKGNMEGEDHLKEKGIQPQFPLLKSPSESWLRHKALPSMAAGKPSSSRSQIGSRVKPW